MSGKLCRAAICCGCESPTISNCICRTSRRKPAIPTAICESSANSGRVARSTHAERSRLSGQSYDVNLECEQREIRGRRRGWQKRRGRTTIYRDRTSTAPADAYAAARVVIHFQTDRSAQRKASNNAHGTCNMLAKDLGSSLRSFFLARGHRGSGLRGERARISRYRRRSHRANRWDKPGTISKTTPTLQVVVNPLLRRASPIHDQAFPR